MLPEAAFTGPAKGRLLIVCSVDVQSQYTGPIHRLIKSIMTMTMTMNHQLEKIEGLEYTNSLF